MTAAGRRLAALPEDALEGALRDLGPAIAWPEPTPTLSVGVRERLAAQPRQPWLHDRLGRGRPIRRSLVLALAVLLVLAAIAGAAGLGLPGLRFILGGAAPRLPVATPTPAGSSPAALGAGFGLGTPTTLAEASASVDFPLLLPTEPAVGPPDAVYVAADRVVVAWSPSDVLPDVEGDGVGLLISEFRGRLDGGYIEKLIDTGTRLEAVTVGGATGYWISGGPHFFRYVDERGIDVEDTHRAVGDTLVWTRDGVTYRIESSLGFEATLAMAEALAPG